MRRTLAAAGLLAFGLAPLFAQEPPKPAPAVPVETLVEQLSDRNFRTREAAAKALAERGEAALPALRKAFEAGSNAEARRRLQGIITGLERDLALSPKRVTLKVKDQPVNEVVDAIAKQTGYAIQLQGNRGARVTMNLDKVTFWEAMDRVCLDTGLFPQHNDGGPMQLYQQDQVWPFVSYHGPFKVMAQSFNYNKQLTLGGLQRNPGLNQPRSETLQLSFIVQSEPKLPIMQIYLAKVTDAVDEFGAAMKAPTANVHETLYYSGGYRSHNQPGNVTLLWPNKEAKVVKRLRGSIPVTVLAFQRPDIVVDDILKVKNKKFSGSGAELDIAEVKDQNNKTQCHIKMTVRNLTPNSAQDYQWANTVQQRVELFDAKGNKFFPQGMSWENGTPGSVQATFMFGSNGAAGVGPPARLVYNHWGLLPYQVDFEFRDLPLP
jgi:hypothetical protein